jgi:hypothetical protein
MLKTGASAAVDGLRDGPRPISGIADEAVRRRGIEQAVANVGEIEFTSGD